MTKDQITLTIVQNRVKAIQGQWTPAEKAARAVEGQRRRTEFCRLVGIPTEQQANAG